uniref:Secreted protein n=1 Tax=Aegilops tauschii subsp. strangulata TaxID=200361 RepID=A0A453PJC1_AEGTS
MLRHVAPQRFIQRSSWFLCFFYALARIAVGAEAHSLGSLLPVYLANLTKLAVFGSLRACQTLLACQNLGYQPSKHGLGEKISGWSRVMSSL